MKSKVVAYAVQVFGSQDVANTWLNSYNDILGNKPIDLLSTEQGCNRVNNILANIEEQAV